MTISWPDESFALPVSGIGGLRGVRVSWDQRCWYVLPLNHKDTETDLEKMRVLFNEQDIVAAGLGYKEFRDLVNERSLGYGLNRSNFGPEVQRKVIKENYDDFNYAWREVYGKDFPLKANAPINSIYSLSYADWYRNELGLPKAGNFQMQPPVQGLR